MSDMDEIKEFVSENSPVHLSDIQEEFGFDEGEAKQAVITLGVEEHVEDFR